MEDRTDNDLYIQPQSDEEINQEARLNNQEGSKAEQKIAANPNPRANENIKGKIIFTHGNSETHQAGSEITDGEDG